MVRIFLVFTYICQEDVAKIPYFAGGKAQFKSGPGITRLVSITFYRPNDSPRQFLHQTILLKK